MTATALTPEELQLNEDEINELADMAQFIEDTAIEKVAPESDQVALRDLALIGIAAGAVRMKMEQVCGAEVTRGVAVQDGFQRYCIESDNSGHQYFIPFNKRDEWNEWLEIPEDDERSWDAPEYAERIDGGTLTFIAPKIL